MIGISTGSMSNPPQIVDAGCKCKQTSLLLLLALKIRFNVKMFYNFIIPLCSLPTKLQVVDDVPIPESRPRV